MDGDHGWDLFQRAFESALAVVGAGLSALAAWMLRAYHKDKAMLKRHEDRLNINDGELGLNREFRLKASEAPMGKALAEAFRSVDDQLDDLRDGQRKLEGKQQAEEISRTKLEGHIGEIKNDVGHINKGIERIERRLEKNEQNKP